MGVRWQWILGLIGLVTLSLTRAQDAAPTVEGAEAEGNGTETSTKPPLTGNPQIDYIHDPNLPHELKGYDLSDYPFYARLPEDLLLPSFNFTCDDRHDGFYASVPHKCQVYHNCLFGQRYDFLCANFTVFDQKNFICHYVSEVDCANSALHYDRNDELYVTTTTTTPRPPQPQIIYVDRPRPGNGPERVRPRPLRPFGGNRRRPGKRRTTTTPPPEYYDDYYYDEYYDQYYDDYYNDYNNKAASTTTTSTTTTTTQRPRRPNRPLRKRVESRRGGGGGPFGGSGPFGGGERRSGPGERFNVKDRKRPRINPPLPQEEEFADQGPRSSRLQQSSPAEQQVAVDEPRQNSPSGSPRRRPVGRKPRPGGRPKKTTTTTTTTTTTEAAPEDEYYDYYYDDYDYGNDGPSIKTTTSTQAPARQSRPGLSRNRPGGPQRRQQSRTESVKTTTTTEAPTTEAPRNRVTRPRVNIRVNPVNSRNSPVEGAFSLEETQGPPPTQDTAGSENQRFQRIRPRDRPQGQSNSVRQETVIEEIPLVEENIAEPEIRRTVGSAPSLSRTPIRRLGSRGQESQTLSNQQIGQERQTSSNQQRGRRRGSQQNRPSTPDYYDY